MPLRSRACLLVVALCLQACAGGDDSKLEEIRGIVESWGTNDAGKLGDNAQTFFSADPVTVLGIDDAASISAGRFHGAALLADGTVRTWGLNGSGLLGDGTVLSRSYPVRVVTSYAYQPLLTGVTAIIGGTRNTAALGSGGALYIWGQNGYGTIGDGSTTDRLFPSPTPVMSGVSNISLGFMHTVAILAPNGDVRAWGRGVEGEVGNGANANRLSPVAVREGSADFTGASAVSAGGYHSLALKNDGTVRSWGKNDKGQLGDGTTANRNSAVTVGGLSGVIAIACGFEHSAALLVDGTVRAWGENTDGQLGDGSTINRLTPISVLTTDGSPLTGITAISAGYRHTLALRNDGSVWGWGANEYGQLGGGNRIPRSFAAPIAGISDAIQIGAGAYYGMALSPTGSISTWGSNSSGVLGIGVDPQRLVPGRVERLSGVRKISTQSSHAVALMEDGTIRAWGYNGYGGLGDGTTIPSATPVAVRTRLSDPTLLSSVGDVQAGASYTAALMIDGTVRVWGWNGNFVLGKGSAVEKSLEPVAIPGLDDVVAIAAANWHMVALLRDGTLRSWGYGQYGALGNGSMADSTVPVVVRTSATDASPLSGVKAVAGGSNTIALMNDGTIRTWGRNGVGQLGDGTTTNRSAPVVVMDGSLPLSNVAAVASNIVHTVVLLQDGTLRAWGQNDYGQLGDGTTTQRARPVVVRKSATDSSPLTDVVAVSAGYYHTAALLKNGTVRCWGKNDDGELGIGTTAPQVAPAEVPGLTGVRGIAAGYGITLALR